MAKKNYRSMVYTDLHVHAHKDRVDRLHHCIDVQDWVFRKAAEYDCRYIFFLGDLFHDQDKIDVLTYLRTFECFMKHMIDDAADRDVYLMVGNHDMYLKHRWDVNSVKPFSAIPRVHLIDKPTQMVIGDRKIDWMPHTHSPMKLLDELKAKNGGAGDILFGHLAVHGATLNTFFGTKADVINEYDNEMVPVEAKVFDDWGMTILGHYHAAQKLNDKVEYLGSPLQLSFGESFQKKHIMMLDLETLEKEYIENDFSPKHLIIKPNDITDGNYDLTGQFLRLEVPEMSAKNLIDLKMEIARAHKPLSLDVKPPEKKTEEDKTVIENARTIIKNVNDMLTTYVESKGVPDGLDPDRIKRTGLRCLTKRAQGSK